MFNPSVFSQMWLSLPHMVGSSTAARYTSITGVPQGRVLWPLKF